MNRRALRVLLSSALLLTACTSAKETPPPPAEQTPPNPGADPPPVSDQPIVPTDAPEGSTLEWVRANACEDAAPMSLTASDGTGLRLASLTARAVVEGPLAFTELRLSFDNPEDRQLEGRFSITLPPGAAISRFAMKIDGRMQEGEVVERQAARVAYEDFLHRRQDPALLEKDAGNVFRARVFPIPPRARKELVISYSQELVHSAEPYRLPLCGLPELDLLDVDVAIIQGAAPSAVDSSLAGQTTSVYHLALRREHLAPTKDLEARVGVVSAQGLRYGDLAMARVVPVLEAPAQPITDLTILMDTSASRALDFRGQVERLGAMVAELPGEAKIEVLAYDQSTESIYSGRADGFDIKALDRLRERGALGASDLSGALGVLAARASLSSRLLLVGDGVVTAGLAEASELQTRLRALGTRGLKRVDAIVDGGIQDQEMLTALTRAGLADDGVVLDARLEASMLAERLGQATRSGITVTVPGAEWVWPTTLDSVQPGDERLIYVQLPPDRALKVKLEGAGVRDPEPTLASVPEALLARAHAQARIAHLQARRAELAVDDAERRTSLQDEIVSLSIRHRVLSDFTALLVLETEADYARFGIDRRALADIMTVGPSGIDKLRRVGPVVPEPEEVELPQKMIIAEADDMAKEDKGGAFAEVDGRFMPGAADGEGGEDVWGGLQGTEVGEAFGMGGLGLIGTGRGGGGTAEARADEEEPMMDAPPSPVAAVPPADPAPEPRRRIARRPRRSAGRAEAPPSPASEIVAPTGGHGVRGEKPPTTDPYQGRFATIMDAIARGDLAAADLEASSWRKESPGDVLALVALGEVAEARGKPQEAARAYGSLVDLFPSRADIRRMAGERLERLGGDALTLAIDTYAHAVEQRPDHPSSHRLYAFALLKADRHAEAFAALEAALDRSYPGGRFAGGLKVLGEDLGLVGAAWIAVDPSARKQVEASLAKHGVTLATSRSTRFVLNWETDANDVDLHVYDARGGHAYYSSRSLSSGGVLYADVTTGYGPECFTIEGKRSAGPYRVLAHYYSRGPMGYGMGKLEVIEHDGSGGLRFSEHPFVIMKDNGYVDLATVGTTIRSPPGLELELERVEVGGMTELGE